MYLAAIATEFEAAISAYGLLKKKWFIKKKHKQTKKQRTMKKLGKVGGIEPLYLGHVKNKTSQPMT